MRNLILFLLVFLVPLEGFSGGISAFSTETATALERAAAIYNAYPATVEDWAALVGARATTPSDRKFLEDFAHENKGSSLPRVRVVAGKFFVDGLEGAVRALDWKHGKFQYQGRSFTVDTAGSIEGNMKKIQVAIKPGASVLGSFLLPEAEAAHPLLLAGAAIWAVGGVLVYLGCGSFGDSGIFHNDPACAGLAAGWPIVALAGGVVWGVSKMAGAAELPKGLVCLDSIGFNMLLADGTSLTVKFENGKIVTDPPMAEGNERKTFEISAKALIDLCKAKPAMVNSAGQDFALIAARKEAEKRNHGAGGALERPEDAKPVENPVH